MFRNYLTVAVRNLLRHKVYSLINILGLAIGLTCCILILLYVQDDLSYDRHHEKADRIYRVIREIHMKGTDPSYSVGTLGPLAAALQDDFPEIQHAVRAHNRGTWISYGDKGFFQSHRVADASILDVFTLPLIKGDPQTVLKDPYSILLTEQMAQKYFGDEGAIGKVVNVEDKYFGGDYTITGILQDIPRNSHFYFDCLSSTVTPSSFMQDTWVIWHQASYRPVQTYLLLHEGHAPAELERKFPDFVERHMGAEVRAHMTYSLQPLTRIYLYSNVDYGIPWYGGITYVYLFSSIAFFILLIACINFMNLATARSANRAQEVGMRKVVGTHRVQLIGQFLGESILLSFLALLLAVVLVGLVLPAFNDLAGKPLSLNMDNSGLMLLGLPVIGLLVGLLAGSYPAFLLSAFQPVEVLKGTLKIGSKSTWLRRGLVVFQFSISIFLIIGTMIVYNQMEYIRNRKMGFAKEQIVVMNILWQDQSLIQRYEIVKNEFLQHPNVLKATASLSLIGIWGSYDTFRLEDAPGEEWRMLTLVVDEDFLETYEMKLIAGRNLPEGTVSDSSQAFILNETAVKKLGWTDPIGKPLELETNKGIFRGNVIGVVKDFHTASLREEIAPTVLYKYQPLFRWISLKISSDNIPATMDFLKKKWKRLIPQRPFRSSFLDDDLDGMYRTEMRLSQIFRIFSLLAIFIACLGLLGLTSFTTQQRTKEIGIRKVLGASVSSIVLLLSKEFVKLVAVANIIAWPVAYYIMKNWLQDFAYRIDIGIETFVLGGVLALLIALITVGYQAVKAATANPVDALRYE